MPGRREDQRFGKYTDTRPGPRPPKKWNKRERENLLYKPGEVWEVHACRNKAPESTVHYVLIGEPPRSWIKKFMHCERVPRMHSMLRFGTPAISSMEVIRENMHYLRNAELYERNWTVNFHFDFVAGYLTMVRAIAFEPWKTMEERVDLGVLEAQSVPEYGSTVTTMAPGRLGKSGDDD